MYKRTSNRVLTFLVFSILLMICISCQHKEAYYYFYSINKTKWAKTDTLFFNIDSTQIEVNVPYNITVELVNNTDYPYQNIWFYIQDNIPYATIFEKHEHQYIIANEFGKWYGAGFGALYQLSLMYKEKVIFNEKRNYMIKVQHGMRDEPLIGIEKVGIKIERIE